jgi:hypothetical protein
LAEAPDVAAWSSLALLQVLLTGGRLMEFRLELLIGLLSEGLLDELAGLTALATDEPFRFDTRLTVGGDDDFNRLQAAPPT